MNQLTNLRHEFNSAPSPRSETETPKDFWISAPLVFTVNGRGVTRWTGEKFSENAVTGTRSIIDQIACRSASCLRHRRADDCRASNVLPAGFNWSLSLASVIRKTQESLSQKIDIFMLFYRVDLIRPRKLCRRMETSVIANTRRRIL